MAQIRVPVPFSPVPISGQTLALCLTAGFLKPKQAFLSQATYLTAGVLGLPLFSNFQSGLAIILGPTGGYLIAFPVFAFMASALLQKTKSIHKDQALILNGFVFILVSLFTVFLFGLIWLSFWSSSWANTLQMGLIPFIPGLLIKSALASLIITKLNRS